jgi:hydrogenase maturation protein HypF
MTAIADESKRLYLSRQITLRGSVQGRGIRPIVARLARSMGLGGSVRNEMSGVIIDAYGCSDALDRFLRDLRRELPAGTIVTRDEQVDDLPAEQQKTFRIRASIESGPTRTIVPTDRVICAACLREVQTRNDRRFGYPFTNCTSCGPRYSILRSMPYDRGRTSMSGFEMCSACRKEYEDPQSRRFHSQTNCCHECGPRFWSTDSHGGSSCFDQQALEAAVATIRAGQIVALKGIGGYQLICDATDEAAVARLRQGKRRPSKPLAVMVIDLDSAQQLVHLSEVEREGLASAAGPIVIARRRTGSILAPSTNASCSDLGIMLPTSALHFLLLQSAGVPLIVTSGNIGNHPIEYREQEVVETLASVVDCFLHHDREIVRPIDDSVVRCMADRLVTIRAGRGIAPISLNMPLPGPAVAVGGQQKVAVAISNGHQAVLGPHIGDLDSVASRERFADQTESLCRLYRCNPDLVVHDRHPDYWTTQYAAEQSHRSTQHHHAHIVSAMAECDWLDKTVLGVAFDGTGLGSDNTIWGGEFLIASTSEFKRVGFLRPFPLAGGEAAIRDPVRVAIALIRDAFDGDATSALNVIPIEPQRREAILGLLDSSLTCPITSSIGRLFDGVALMTLNDFSCTFEGEPAMLLEAACDETDSNAYELVLTNDSPFQLDWRPLIRQLVDDRRRGVAGGKIAMRFHRGLARSVINVIERFADLPIVLTGGVFQNRRLVELIAAAMPKHRAIALPGVVPPNDGGLAIGQLAVAAATVSHSRREPCA